MIVGAGQNHKQNAPVQAAGVVPRGDGLFEVAGGEELHPGVHQQQRDRLRGRQVRGL